MTENFARGIKEDWAAVENGVTYQWSNGQVEGQVRDPAVKRRKDPASPTQRQSAACRKGMLSDTGLTCGIAPFWRRGVSNFNVQ